jgi:hypothetical protein
MPSILQDEVDAYPIEPTSRFSVADSVKHRNRFGPNVNNQACSAGSGRFTHVIAMNRTLSSCKVNRRLVRLDTGTLVAPIRCLSFQARDDRFRRLERLQTGRVIPHSTGVDVG